MTTHDRHPTDEPDGTTAYEASLRRPGDSVTKPAPSGDDPSVAGVGDFAGAEAGDSPAVNPHAGYDEEATSGDTSVYRPD
ncbi:hypothetical protein [Symbioplanes lichenis]|uniref:hypothetical protein n=1 Tax=Symbioplanes lichenis TaxID=1629072 RepID=UPI002738D869|nr:hypothetical protein [Actinoplanes lichenis]